MTGIILVNTPPLGIEKVHPLQGHGDLKRENNQDYVSRKEVGQWPLGRNQQGLPHRYIMSLDPQGNLVGWELSSFFIGEVKLPRSTSYEVKELGFKQRLPDFNHHTKSDESGQRKLLITETCLFQIHSPVSFEFALNLYFSLSVEKALENCYCRV